ncbi:MAG: hypothetical protein IJY74_05095 [Oscillospiraceae bacterium]|nr:hypothetical protein [Oscillospiraceae bacterium]
MTDYKSLYFYLFNGISEIAEKIEHEAEKTENTESRDILENFIINMRKVQCATEEIYMKS